MLSVMTGTAPRILDVCREFVFRMTRFRGPVSAGRRRLGMAAVVLGTIIGSPSVFAFTTPAAGSFGYDVYNTVVNDILGGPIGFVGGVMFIAWGATQLMRSWMTTILCVIGGTILIKLTTILTSLGAVI